VVADGMLLVGDAAGVAYSESGEGIRPALESSLLAAATLIAAGGATGVDDLQPYQVALGRQHPVSRETPPAWRAIQKPLGRLLLGSRSFTRRVVLDRWFLRPAG
jgi:flavin-dependent dehydrogenase